MTFYRAVFYGTFNNGEEWQTSFGINDTGLSSTEDVAQDLKSSYDAHPEWVKNRLRTTDIVSGLKVYRLPSIGAPASELAEELIGDSGGSSAGNTLPPQCAVAISLLTGFPGRTKRGRMFLPIRGSTLLTGDGLLGNTFAQDWADDAAAFFSDFNNSLSGRRIVVLSGKDSAAYNITSVSVGNVIDTQRRRRNSLPEGRFGATVTSL